MLPIEVLGRLVQQEKLGAIRLRSVVCHAEDAAATVAELLLELVGETVTPDALATATSACGISTLDHEILDGSVEDDIVIVALGAESQKVLASLWHQITMQLEVDVAMASPQLDVSLLLGLLPWLLCLSELCLLLCTESCAREATVIAVLLIQSSSPLGNSLVGRGRGGGTCRGLASSRGRGGNGVDGGVGEAGALLLLLGRHLGEAILHVVEVRPVDGARVLGVVDRDDVLPRERLVVHQVPPVLRLDVQLCNCLVGVDVAGGLDSNDVCVLRERPEGSGALVVSFCVAVECELDQVLRCHGLASHRVHFVLLQEWHDLQ
mmetsp:Transcript_22631/g.89528  ORF Transcript_22631/g.89528 Transcript_22631/m.89528 type:complete len:321 (+) Transcript_22631:466-1428(+)